MGVVKCYAASWHEDRDKLDAEKDDGQDTDVSGTEEVAALGE